MGDTIHAEFKVTVTVTEGVTAGSELPVRDEALICRISGVAEDPADAVRLAEHFIPSLCREVTGINGGWVHTKAADRPNAHTVEVRLSVTYTIGGVPVVSEQFKMATEFNGKLARAAEAATNVARERAMAWVTNQLRRSVTDKTGSGETAWPWPK